jgi:hypothetical protein
MQREDLAITIAPAPQALQPEIISHSISHDDHARSPNVPMKIAMWTSTIRTQGQRNPPMLCSWRQSMVGMYIQIG